MDVAQTEEGEGRSSGNPTLSGQSASVTSRPTERRVMVATPQPAAMVTGRRQDQGRIPVAGVHSKSMCYKYV